MLWPGPRRGGAADVFLVPGARPTITGRERTAPAEPRRSSWVGPARAWPRPKVYFEIDKLRDELTVGLQPYTSANIYADLSSILPPFLIPCRIPPDVP